MLGHLILRAADHRHDDSLAARLRSERLRKFADMLQDLSSPVRILDVGGSAAFWMKHRPSLPVESHITVLNLEHPAQPRLPWLAYVIGDARRLTMFDDAEFDACFSNSLIEHVGGSNDQVLAAREIRRVANAYFVQTPNRYFPLEPHFLVPGWQFAPISLRVQLLRRWDLGWMKKIEDPRKARATVESIRLLSEGDVRRLFPDGRIYREKVGLLTKSITAYRPLS